jgi:hypothetical protein
VAVDQLRLAVVSVIDGERLVQLVGRDTAGGLLSAAWVDGGLDVARIGAVLLAAAVVGAGVRRRRGLRCSLAAAGGLERPAA